MWDTIAKLLVAAGIGAIITTVITVWSQRRKLRAEAGKTNADAAQVLTESALSVVNALRDECATLRSDLSTTRRELRALRVHLGSVEDLLRSNGIPAPQFVWSDD